MFDDVVTLFDVSSIPDDLWSSLRLHYEQFYVIQCFVMFFLYSNWIHNIISRRNFFSSFKQLYNSTLQTNIPN